MRRAWRSTSQTGSQFSPFESVADLQFRTADGGLGHQDRWSQGMGRRGRCAPHHLSCTHQDLYSRCRVVLSTYCTYRTWSRTRYRVECRTMPWPRSTLFDQWFCPALPCPALPCHWIHERGHARSRFGANAQHTEMGLAPFHDPVASAGLAWGLASASLPWPQNGCRCKFSVLA